MENLRKHVDVKLVRSNEEERLKKLIASPAFNRSKIFDNIKFNFPVYDGMGILDLTKHLMYDFYYNELTRKKQYGDKFEVLYTDIDSLLMEIQTKDVYKDMAEKIDMYNTSDYPKDDPLHSAVNKKVLGKMKDECAGTPIVEYVGLRPKMYSIKKTYQTRTV